MYYDTSGELYMLWKVAQVFARGVGLLFCSHHLSLGRKADKYVHTLQFFLSVLLLVELPYLAIGQLCITSSTQCMQVIYTQ